MRDCRVIEKIGGWLWILVHAIQTGSWQFAKELEMERALFPEAYALRMRLKKEK